MVRGVPVLVFFLLAVGLGCGGDESSTSPPCVVTEKEMASIWEMDEMRAVPAQDGRECVYLEGEGDERMVGLWLRSDDEFVAERKRFTDHGFLLPPLTPIDGFPSSANIDPRYNSLNVILQDSVVSVEILGREPADPADQVAIEKRIAHAALDRLAGT
jgi:hypothetical protein